GGVLFEERLALGEAAEVLGALLVDGGVVLVGARREVDLGADDVEERERLAPGELGGLRARDDVVGDGGDLGGVVGVGTEGPERADRGHGAGERAVGKGRKDSAAARSPYRGRALVTGAFHTPLVCAAWGRPPRTRILVVPTAGWRSGISSGS